MKLQSLAYMEIFSVGEQVFTAGARYPLAGLLLVLPALEAAGLLACAKAAYGRLRNGFCGLAAMLLVLVFLALAGAGPGPGSGG